MIDNRPSLVLKTETLIFTPVPHIPKEQLLSFITAHASLFNTSATLTMLIAKLDEQIFPLKMQYYETRDALVWHLQQNQQLHTYTGFEIKQALLWQIAVMSGEENL